MLRLIKRTSLVKSHGSIEVAWCRCQCARRDTLVNSRVILCTLLLVLRGLQESAGCTSMRLFVSEFADVLILADVSFKTFSSEARHTTSWQKSTPTPFAFRHRLQDYVACMRAISRRSSLISADLAVAVLRKWIMKSRWKVKNRRVLTVVCRRASKAPNL